MKTNPKTKQRVTALKDALRAPAVLTHPNSGLESDTGPLQREAHKIEVRGGGSPGMHTFLKVALEIGQTATDQDVVEAHFEQIRWAAQSGSKDTLRITWQPTLAELEQLAVGLHYAVARLRQRPLRATVQGVQDYTIDRI